MYEKHLHFSHRVSYESHSVCGIISPTGINVCNSDEVFSARKEQCV
jgi:hypothetical protein